MNLFHIFTGILASKLGSKVYDENDILEYSVEYDEQHRMDVSERLGYNAGEVYHYDRPDSFFGSLSTRLMRKLPTSTDDHSVPWNYDLDAETAGYGFKFRDLAVFSQKLSNLTRMEQLEYMVHGIGLPLLQKVDGTFDYCIDLSMMELAEVRAGYMNYGSYIIFDQNKHVKRILYNGDWYDREEIPEAVACISLASIVVYTTVVLHAGLCHFKISGNISAALRLYLSRNDDPVLEDLTRIFCFRNPEINSNALNLLVSDGGIVQRLFALTAKGVDTLLQMTRAEETRFVNWIFDNSGSTHIEQQINYFTQYTKDFLSKLDNNADIKQLLLVQITVSTLIHELVGSTIGIYLLHPDSVKTKILVEEVDADHLCVSQSSFHLTKSIVYLTSGITVPMLLHDNMRFCINDEHYRRAFMVYQQKLRTIAPMTRNGDWNTSYFDVRNAETSISL